MSGGGTQTPEFRWAELVARTLHPIDVQIIEALQWIEQPLSAGDLSQLFDRKPSWVLFSHRMRRLAKIDAIELAETPAARNIADISYRLVVKRQSDGL